MTCIASFILGGGWLWARSVIWYKERQEGFIAIGAASRGKDYRFWGLTVPTKATGTCSMVYVLALAVACTRRRRLGLLPLVVVLALALAVAYVCLFADLEFEAFD